MKEKGSAALVDPNSKVGREDPGRTLTSFWALRSSSSFNGTEVVTKVKTNCGRDDESTDRALTLAVSTSDDAFNCSLIGSGCDVGLVGLASGLQVNLNDSDGGENLKSDFGRDGGVCKMVIGGAGDGGSDDVSAWKLNLSLLGSLGIELGLTPLKADRDVGLLGMGDEDEDEAVGLVSTLWERTGALGKSVSLPFPFLVSSITTSSLISSTVISGLEEGMNLEGIEADVSIPLVDGLLLFEARVESSSSSSGSSTT